MRKINLVFVPSKLTWMLQPLDVAVFSSLKRAYHRRVLDMRMANAGAVPDGAWVPCLAGSVSEVVLGRPWRELLSKCGCLGLEGLQSLIAQQVAGTEVPRAPPGLEDLQTPRVNKEVLVAELLSLVSRAFPVTHGKGPLELGHRGW
jgi:hypothetical protein